MRMRATGLTLMRYVACLYARALAAVMGIVMALVYLFDTVELMRRAAGKDGAAAALMMEMGLLKLPEVGQAALPFVVLVAAMFTLWGLARSSELTVMRAAGLSPWRMVVPMAGVALALGVFQLAVLNPLGAALLSRFKRLEAQHLNYGETPQIALFAQGLWLRENVGDSYTILHAREIGQAGQALTGVTALEFGADDARLSRVDAPTGRLEPGAWVLEGATRHAGAGAEPEALERWALPTTLTPLEIARSFSDTSGMAFWALPGHIAVLEATGFDAGPLRVRYHHLLAAPVVFVAMVLVAAALFVRPARGGGVLLRAGAGLVGGLGVFFAIQFSEALGASGQLAPALAAWGPAVIALLVSASLVLRLEEG